MDNYYMQNDVTIRPNRSIERKYKRTNDERTMVTEQNPTSCLMIIVESSNVLI